MTESDIWGSGDAAVDDTDSTGDVAETESQDSGDVTERSLIIVVVDEHRLF